MPSINLLIVRPVFITINHTMSNDSTQFQQGNPMREETTSSTTTAKASNVFARNPKITAISVAGFAAACALAFGLGFGLSARNNNSSSSSSDTQYATPVVAYLSMPALQCVG